MGKHKHKERDRSPSTKHKDRDRSRSRSPAPKSRSHKNRSRSPRPQRKENSEDNSPPKLRSISDEEEGDRRRHGDRRDRSHERPGSRDREKHRKRDRDDVAIKEERRSWSPPAVQTRVPTFMEDKPNIKQEEEEGDEERRKKRKKEKKEKKEKRERSREGHRGGGSGGGRNMEALLEDVKKEEDGKPEKQKANLGLSGKLTEDTNTFRGVVIKYSEPVEARKPKTKWRLYQFKGDQSLPTLYVHRQSAFLIGRDRLIADISVDHPSCSKQHAVLQYRLVEYERPDGSTGKNYALHNRSRCDKQDLSKQQANRPPTVLRTAREGRAQIRLLIPGIRPLTRQKRGRR